MRKKVIVVVCLVALATSVFAASEREALRNVLRTRFSGTAAPKQPAAPFQAARSPQEQARQTPPPRTVPQHAVYNEFFYHVNFLKRKADKEEKEGKDAAALRLFYKRQAKLDEAQDRILKEIASGLERDLDQMDQKAEAIIKRFREEVQAMQLKPGDTPPAPPETLKVMQAERDALVLKARDQLRLQLGEATFARLDHYVQQNIAPRMTAERFDRPRPENPNRPR